MLDPLTKLCALEEVEGVGGSEEAEPLHRIAQGVGYLLEGRPLFHLIRDVSEKVHGGRSPIRGFVPRLDRRSRGWVPGEAGREAEE